MRSGLLQKLAAMSKSAMNDFGVESAPFSPKGTWAGERSLSTRSVFRVLRGVPSGQDHPLYLSDVAMERRTIRRSSAYSALPCRAELSATLLDVVSHNLAWLRGRRRRHVWRHVRRTFPSP